MAEYERPMETKRASLASENVKYDDLRTEFDHPVEVFGKTMNVNIQGSGSKVAVILPGRGVTAPSYDFAPLIAQMKGECKILTIDYFGSGLSDMTDEPRDSDHIVAEVHEALSKLGVNECNLIAHSISGIYALHYSNLYPNEVTSLIGIDTAFPRMEQFITPELVKKTSVPKRFAEATHDIREDISDVVGYTYSTRELEVMQALYERNCNNDAIFEARKNQNIGNVRPARPYDAMRFPESVPTLFFLSSESVGYAPDWYVQEHKKQCTPVAGSGVMILEGGHFLYHSQAAAIARGIAAR